MKTIYLTVTNDLTYDQRMIRIGSSLAKVGYDVCLIGRERPHSQPLVQHPFRQKRLRCWMEQGKLFYLEYNLRLFWWLLWQRWDVVCSVDLDTILPGFWVARLKGKTCVYDAHEYFTEVPEVVERPRVKRIWEWVAQHTIPRLRHAYTVCESLKIVFEQRYGTPFEVVRNVPFERPTPPAMAQPEPPYILLYQGVLNDGRGIEELLHALPLLPEVQLWLAGEGDRSAALRQQVLDLDLQDRVVFHGYVQPEQLKTLTEQAHIGINLLQNKGLNYYYSLANKFFDYVQAHKPSLNSAFPEYQTLLTQYEVGATVPDLAPATLAKAIQQLTENPAHYLYLQQQCALAQAVWTWEKEEQTLLRIYQAIAKNPSSPPKEPRTR